MFLLFLSLVPFASSTLGEYSTEPTALHLYGVVLIAASLLRIALNAYFQTHPGLLWQASSKDSRRLIGITTSAPIVVYVLAMVAANWSTTLSLILYFSIPLALLRGGRPDQCGPENQGRGRRPGLTRNRPRR